MRNCNLFWAFGCDPQTPVLQIESASKGASRLFIRALARFGYPLSHFSLGQAHWQFRLSNHITSFFLLGVLDFFFFFFVRFPLGIWFVADTRQNTGPTPPPPPGGKPPQKKGRKKAYRFTGTVRSRSRLSVLAPTRPVCSP
jgi:hypothetical protein